MSHLIIKNVIVAKFIVHGLTNMNGLACPHPEGAVVGGAEHFGLVRSGDHSKSVNCTHVTRQRPHLLFRFNVPHLEEKKAHHHLQP